MTITGLHHIALTSRDLARTTDFYTGALGLRLLTSAESSQAVFGAGSDRATGLISFTEQPDAPRGLHGIGGTHHFALAVSDYDGLLRWKRRLIDRGVAIRGPYDRKYFVSIYMDDPDGGVVEIATNGPGFAVDEQAELLGQNDQMPPTEHTHTMRSEAEIAALMWPEPVPDITPDMALRGLHHITAIGADIFRTHEFYGGLLGLQLVKRTFNFDDLNSRHWYWGVDGGRPGSLITYFERDPRKTRQAVPGAGMTRHFAFAVEDAAALTEWSGRLGRAGIEVSEVMDHGTYTYISARDPDGHTVQLAASVPV